jgi:hypothetical protein
MTLSLEPPEPAENDDEVRLGIVKMTVSSRPSADDDGCHITITIDNQACGDRLLLRAANNMLQA